MLKTKTKGFYPIESFDVCEELANRAPLLCSTFYLLHYLYKEKKRTELEFDYRHICNQLDYAFQRYILYTCARESRHIYTPDAVEFSPGDVESEFPAIHSIVSEILKKPEDLRPVRVAEAVFMHIKNTRESVHDYMQQLVILFRWDWRGSFGGGSWAYIANLLVERLENSISKVTFIDAAWHAEHNYRLFLDKLANDDTITTLGNILHDKCYGHLTALFEHSDLPPRYKALCEK
ncbi:MAG: hypothetical protein DRO95_05375 [Candidatus Altiarchaeales archaeon]|nr:MAG: hypothetical protein DRO95_05375 [Candidatus Altiarchaeales archaeon]